MGEEGIIILVQKVLDFHRDILQGVFIYNSLLQNGL